MRRMNKKQQEQWDMTLKLVWPFILIGLFFLFIGVSSGIEFLGMFGLMMVLTFGGTLVW